MGNWTSIMQDKYLLELHYVTKNQQLIMKHVYLKFYEEVTSYVKYYYHYIGYQETFYSDGWMHMTKNNKLCASKMYKCYILFIC